MEAKNKIAPAVFWSTGKLGYAILNAYRKQIKTEFGFVPGVFAFVFVVPLADNKLFKVVLRQGEDIKICKTIYTNGILPDAGVFIESIYNRITDREIIDQMYSQSKEVELQLTDTYWISHFADTQEKMALYQFGLVLSEYFKSKITGGNRYLIQILDPFGQKSVFPYRFSEAASEVLRLTTKVLPFHNIIPVTEKNSSNITINTRQQITIFGKNLLNYLTVSDISEKLKDYFASFPQNEQYHFLGFGLHAFVFEKNMFLREMTTRIFKRLKEEMIKTGDECQTNEDLVYIADTYKDFAENNKSILISGQEISFSLAQIISDFRDSFTQKFESGQNKSFRLNDWLNYFDNAERIITGLNIDYVYNEKLQASRIASRLFVKMKFPMPVYEEPIFLPPVTKINWATLISGSVVTLSDLVLLIPGLTITAPVWVISLVPVIGLSIIGASVKKVSPTQPPPPPPPVEPISKAYNSIKKLSDFLNMVCRSIKVIIMEMEEYRKKLESLQKCFVNFTKFPNNEHTNCFESFFFGDKEYLQLIAKFNLELNNSLKKEINRRTILKLAKMNLKEQILLLDNICHETVSFIGEYDPEKIIELIYGADEQADELNSGRLKFYLLGLTRHSAAQLEEIYVTFGNKRRFVGLNENSLPKFSIWIPENLGQDLCLYHIEDEYKIQFLDVSFIELENGIKYQLTRTKKLLEFYLTETNYAKQ
ncbi:MAG: hypothetical protein V1773_18320 [bacterium]